MRGEANVIRRVDESTCRTIRSRYWLDLGAVALEVLFRNDRLWAVLIVRSRVGINILILVDYQI